MNTGLGTKFLLVFLNDLYDALFKNRLQTNRNLKNNLSLFITFRHLQESNSI